MYDDISRFVNSSCRRLLFGDTLGRKYHRAALLWLYMYVHLSGT